MTYSEFRSGLLGGAFSAVDVTASYLHRIERNGYLNAFLEVHADAAMEQAAAVDRAIRAGDARPLAGLIVAVKDNLALKGSRTTCGSRSLERFVSLYDATVLRRLSEAGAIFIGRTNMDEFAMGSSNENSAFGAVLHPLDRTRVPGGSSGGSAVAVTAELAMAALGTDTGGSIRQPASFCGVVGLKPTYGRVSRYGLVAFASSCDTIGPFTRNVEDAVSILGIIAGKDARDSTSSHEEVPEYRHSLGRGVHGLRLGIPKEYYLDSLQPEVGDAVRAILGRLEREGAVVEEISLPHTAYTIAVYYIITTAEASSNLARYDGARYSRRASVTPDLKHLYTASRSDGFGGEVKRRIMLGTYVLSAGYYDAYYRKAQQVRRLIREDFEQAFRRVDAIITPTTPTTAFRLGEKIEDPLQMYLSDIFTASGNLAGIPGMSLPIAYDASGLPIGIQIYTKSFDEMMLFRVGDAVERLAGFQRRPAVTD